MLKRIISLVSSAGFIKKFSIIVGLLAVMVIIWALGPRMGLHSVGVRLGLILALAIGVVAFYGIRYWLSKRRGQALEDELTDQSASRDADVAALKTKMQQAIASLKSSELGVGKGSAALYALPWYMIIGPSAAGKTTLLRNSGLNFPLSSDEDIHITGFGGTRNCDWWFSDDAVILDTAGRYTTEVNDQDEWVSFLEILKKRRRKLPINGVIVAVSLPEVLTADQAGLNWHANIVRDRIEELTKHLGYVLPVNVVFTKCDLLKGFTDFYKNFSEEECEQVWGVNLLQDKKDNATSGDVIDTIQKKFAELYAKLTQVRIQQLAMEPTARAKSNLFDFPAQFKDAAEKLYRFFGSVINDNPYQNDINLAGVYFTSGCQEGVAVQRDIGSDEQDFSQSAIDSVDKKASHSYFIRRLLSDVIFENKFGAILSRRMQILRSWMKTGFIGLGGLVVVMAVVLWGVAYVDSSRVLTDSVDAVKQLQQTIANSSATRTDIISSQLAVFDQYNKLVDHSDLIPFHDRMGLYEGDKHVGKLKAVLLRTLQNNFMMTVPRAMRERLASYNSRWSSMSAASKAKHYDDYYQTLRDYLLMGYQMPQGDSSKLDAAYLARVWALELRGKFKRDSQLNDIDAGQLAKLTNLIITSEQTGLSKNSVTHAWQPSVGLVRKARKNLYRPVDALSVYEKLSSQLQANLPAVSMADLVKGDNADMLTNANTIPGMYTAAAWKSTVYTVLHHAAVEASSGDWVLSAPISLSSSTDVKPALPVGKGNGVVEHHIEKILRAQYFNNYVDAWYSWLSTAQVNQFLSLDDAVEGLKNLANTDGPMAQLMQAVAINIDAPNTPSDSSIAPELAKPFQALRQFAGGVDGDESVPPALHKYLKNISGSRGAIQNLAIAANAPVQAKQYAAQILNGKTQKNALYQTRATISKMLMNVHDSKEKTAIDNVLVSPVRATWQALLAEASKDVQTQWENQVLPNYQGDIVGRFPFQQDSQQDADMDSIKQFFGLQQGALWKFVHKSLQPFVKQQGMNWVANKWLGVGMGFSPSFLPGLSQAQEISSVLFSNGIQQPKFSFSLYPIPLIDVSEVTLSVNGKAYNYQNGPQQWQDMQWALSQAQQDSQLLVSKGENAQAQLDGTGIWGIFKLLDQASVSGSSSGYLLAWHMKSSDGQSMDVKMKFKTNGPASAIKGFVKTPFQLPSSVTQQVTEY